MIPIIGLILRGFDFTMKKSFTTLSIKFWVVNVNIKQRFYINLVIFNTNDFVSFESKYSTDRQ